MILRVVVISTLLGATVIMNQDVNSLVGASTRFLLSLIVCTYILTIAFAIWYRTGRRLTHLGYVQFSSDAVLFSALSYATGGVTSGFTFLFHLWVIVSVVSMGKRAGFIQATISAFFIILTGMLMEFGVLEPLSDISGPAPSLPTTIYALTVNIIGLYIVAFLVNILSKRLEDAGEGLKQERAQKEELARELEHAKHLAALGELAATLAHEIRNPLSAVSGSFQMLKSGVQIGDEEAALSSIIERELHRMGRLVDDILEYARPRQAELYPVDLSKLCQETVHSFNASILHRGLQLSTVIPEKLFCLGDSNQLRQVIWNLLINASHVVADETGVIKIELTRSSDNIYVDVVDNGPGVPVDIRDKVFDAFFSTRERGMGLGLALCQRIIAGHNGNMEIMDAQSGGAKFRVMLPAINRDGRDSDYD